MTDDSGSELEHSIEVRVRYAETDGQKVLHHSRYLVYFEMGRTELLRELGGDYRAFEEKGLMLVVVKFQIHYHAPAFYDDLLTIVTRQVRQTNVKLVHEYEVRRGSELLTTAESVLACIGPDRKVQRIPEIHEMR